MKDKCLKCPDYQYVTDENRNIICLHCDYEDTVYELKEAFKKTWMYKGIIKLLDWLSNDK